MSSFKSAAVAGKQNGNHKRPTSPRHRRRRAESSQRDSSPGQRVLRDAVEREQVGLEGLKAARFQLLKVFGRIERFGDQINGAFGGEMFLQDIAPDAPANRRRVKAFLEEHIQVAKLLGYAIELWLLTCGMKREDDWVPLLIEDMRLSAQRREDNSKPGDQN